jgi:predicted secreted protein
MSGKEMFNQLVEAFNTDYEKFTGGNKAAGTRARKALSEMSKLCKSLRQEIQDKKNSDK